jgi:hypothetical protein
VCLQFAQNGIHASAKRKHGLQFTALKHLNGRMPDQRIVSMFVIARFHSRTRARQCCRQCFNPISRIKSGVIEEYIHSHSCLFSRCFVFIFKWIVSITNLWRYVIADKKDAFAHFGIRLPEVCLNTLNY